VSGWDRINRTRERAREAAASSAQTTAEDRRAWGESVKPRPAAGAPAAGAAVQRSALPAPAPASAVADKLAKLKARARAQPPLVDPFAGCAPGPDPFSEPADPRYADIDPFTERDGRSAG